MDTGNSADQERSQFILRELLTTGQVTVEKLAAELAVSPSTVRRALRELEEQGLLRRTHGGAVPVEPSLYEPFRHVSSFGSRSYSWYAKKCSRSRRIGPPNVEAYCWF